MKKIISLLLGCSCVFALTACGNEQAAQTTAAQTTLQTEVHITEAQTTTQAAAETTTEVAGTTEATEATTTEAASVDSQAAQTTLVVYFSNTGNTKAIAENIAGTVGADIFEIVAQVPYTAADLNYSDNNSRSTLEMNDSSVRPGIVGSVENMEQYDTIYIGYPIWWGEAPRILSTFVESYDFTGKTIIPFCTSSSSGMGSSGSRLAQVAGSGNWLEGRRFSGSESIQTVADWVNGL